MTHAYASFPRVVVVGGGTTGLSAAHRLNELLDRDDGKAPVLLLESTARLGGQVRTDREGEYLFEGGPDTLLANKPGGVELCRHLGLDDDLIHLEPSGLRTQILHRGRLVPLPDGFMMIAPTRVWPVVSSPLFSWAGTLRMFGERFVPARLREEDDESVGEFVTRRFGREALDRAAEPILGALYTADVHRMSLRAMMPRFAEMERRHGSVTRALRGARKSAAATRPVGQFAYLRGGFGQLVEALRFRLPAESVRTRAHISELSFNPVTERWSLSLRDGQRIETEAVVFACPAFVTARLLADVDESLARSLNEIEYASCATVSLVYAKRDLSRPLDGLGFFVPRSERSPLLACSYVSEKFRARSPADELQLRAFVGGALNYGDLEQDDDELAETVHRELVRVLALRGRPRVARVYRSPRGMPQLEVGFLARRERVCRRQRRHRGLFLAGGAMGAVGVPDCISSGRAAAQAVADYVIEAAVRRRVALP